MVLSVHGRWAKHRAAGCTERGTQMASVGYPYSPFIVRRFLYIKKVLNILADRWTVRYAEITLGKVVHEQK